MRLHTKLKFIKMEDSGLFILYREYHGCWWPSDSRSQRINNSSGIDLVRWVYYGLGTRRDKMMDISANKSYDIMPFLWWDVSLDMAVKQSCMYAKRFSKYPNHQLILYYKLCLLCNTTSLRNYVGMVWATLPIYIMWIFVYILPNDSESKCNIYVSAVFEVHAIPSTGAEWCYQSHKFWINRESV